MTPHSTRRHTPHDATLHSNQSDSESDTCWVGRLLGRSIDGKVYTLHTTPPSTRISQTVSRTLAGSDACLVGRSMGRFRYRRLGAACNLTTHPTRRHTPINASTGTHSMHQSTRCVDRHLHIPATRHNTPLDTTLHSTPHSTKSLARWNQLHNGSDVCWAGRLLGRTLAWSQAIRNNNQQWFG
jgi:hypothetical protein